MPNQLCCTSIWYTSSATCLFKPDSQTCRPSWHTRPERGEGEEKERGRRNEEEEGERRNRGEKGGRGRKREQKGRMNDGTRKRKEKK
jgi:hypothetical protein